jgi:hypothetical protein
MRKTSWLLLIIFAAPLLAQDKKDEAGKAEVQKVEKKKSDDKRTDGKETKDKKTFEEPGKFSIGLPESGFQWKKVQDLKSGNTTGVSYSCSNGERQKIISLVVFNHKAKTDKEKRVFILEEYDEYGRNYKIIEGNKPKLEFKIEDQISYRLRLQDSNGSEFYCYRTTIFGKNLFTISIRAPTADEAKDFQNKLIKSFKELDK